MIDSYSFGKIVIDRKEYTKDVIIFPGKIKDNWWRKKGHELHIEDIEEVFQEAPEVLIVGTGKFGMMKVLPETVNNIKSAEINLIVENTENACKIYNELSKNKKVAAALHLTC